MLIGDWKEQDLVQLKGQEESSRLEFKSSKLYEDRGKFIDTLSKEISGFANSEGGEIVIGINEERVGKTRVAGDIDQGIESVAISTEWLQQSIASNVSPFLPGIKVQRVPLSGDKQGRVAFVITIPQGTTAYQANDKRYYGSVGSSSEPLPDHEIRLRMLKGKVPWATLDILKWQVVTADTEWRERESLVEKLKLQRQTEKDEEFSVYEGCKLREAEELLNRPKWDYDKIVFGLGIVNSGEITIRDLRLQLLIPAPSFVREVMHEHKSDKAFVEDEGLHELRNIKVNKEYKIDFRFASTRKMQEGTTLVERKIFPGNQILFPEKEYEMSIPHSGELDGKDYSIEWKIFLDDAPACSGQLDLLAYFKEQLSQMQHMI